MALLFFGELFLFLPFRGEEAIQSNAGSAPSDAAGAAGLGQIRVKLLICYCAVVFQELQQSGMLCFQRLTEPG